MNEQEACIRLNLAVRSAVAFLEALASDGVYAAPELEVLHQSPSTRQKAGRTVSLSDSAAEELPLALLVEDDPQTREMYAAWLVFSGFRTIQAESADEAMEKALRLRPQVITTDLTLTGTGGDGCNLCERLKADARTRLIPLSPSPAGRQGVSSRGPGRLAAIES